MQRPSLHTYLTVIALFAALLVVAYGQTPVTGLVNRPPERIRFSNGSRSLAVAATTNILSVTGESGRLLSVACRTTTAVTGTPTAQLEINIDGKGSLNQTLYSAGISWVPAVANFFVNGAAAPGDAVDDAFQIGLGSTYGTSATIAVNTTTAGTAGVLDCTVVRATDQ